MDIDNLSKKQVVLLVLLVSFVTSLVTGIVVVSLMSQAPAPITQTIHKVIEKITPLEIQQPAPQQAAPVVVQATQEEMVVRAVKNAAPAVASVVATKDLPVIEQYYVNPFENDDFFKNLPPGFLPDIKIPQYRQNGSVEKQISSGTGFFVSKDGLILTNKHVVEDTQANYLVITNDGKKLAAKVIARDPFLDIAILKVEGDNFSFIPFGDSDKLNVGQTVVAIGNALGEFNNTVSVGIISGLRRNITAEGSLAGAEYLQEVIQTDAAINPGNSGGPLLDLNGRVVGINTAVATGAENIGFTLPINIAKRDVNDAMEFGAIKYPFLGIRYKLVENGLMVVKGSAGEPAVAANSPAAKAGIKEGDIVLEISGTKLGPTSSLNYVLSKYRVDDKIDVKILRDGKEISLTLVLEERPENI